MLGGRRTTPISESTLPPEPAFSMAPEPDASCTGTNPRTVTWAQRALSQNGYGLHYITSHQLYIFVHTRSRCEAAAAAAAETAAAAAAAMPKAC